MDKKVGIVINAIAGGVGVALILVTVIGLSFPIPGLSPLGDLITPNGGLWSSAFGAEHPPYLEIVTPGLTDAALPSTEIPGGFLTSMQ